MTSGVEYGFFDVNAVPSVRLGIETCEGAMQVREMRVAGTLNQERCYMRRVFTSSEVLIIEPSHSHTKRTA